MSKQTKYHIEISGEWLPWENCTGIERSVFGAATLVQFTDEDGEHCEIITRETVVIEAMGPT
jgi:hypothetical protein